jgi:hypothetical protein
MLSIGPEGSLGALNFLQIYCKLRVMVSLVMSWVFVMGRWVVSPVSVGGGIVGGDDDLLSGSVR